MIKVKVNNEYKDVVKIFCGGTLQKEIVKVWSREAQEYVYESSVEYTGSLPITINANGDALLDYRIYGADGGVGVATENLFDKKNSVVGKYLIDDATEGIQLNFAYTDFLKINASVQYTITNYDNTLGGAAAMCFYDANFDFLYGITYNSRSEITFTPETNVAYVRCSYRRGDRVSLSLDSTAPTSYIPYGYKLPMTVGDGDTVQTVPVYIGENQLTEDEYVDYGEQKIYIDVGGTLTPTDPPSPFTEIPTIDGTTIIDYDGDPKPSQMYIKYRR